MKSPDTTTTTNNQAAAIQSYPRILSGATSDSPAVHHVSILGIGAAPRNTDDHGMMEPSAQTMYHNAVPTWQSYSGGIPGFKMHMMENGQLAATEVPFRAFGQPRPLPPELSPEEEARIKRE